MLKIYTSRRFEKAGTIERTIRSIRLIVSDLLAMPMASSSVLIVPTVKAEVDHLSSYPFIRGQDWLASSTSGNNGLRKKEQDTVGPHRRTSLPQLLEHPHNVSERKNGSPGVLRPRNSARVPPSATRSSTSSMSPLSRSYDTESSLGYRRSYHRHSRVPSGSQPRKRNTLKKRSVDGMSSPSSRRSSRGSFNSPRWVRSSRRDHSPSSIQNLRPARPMQLTTSRTSWSGVDRCKVPDRMDSKRHSVQRTTTTVSDFGNGSGSAGRTTPVEKRDSHDPAQATLAHGHDGYPTSVHHNSTVVRQNSKRKRMIRLLTRVIGRP